MAQPTSDKFAKLLKAAGAKGTVTGTEPEAKKQDLASMYLGLDPTKGTEPQALKPVYTKPLLVNPEAANKPLKVGKTVDQFLPELPKTGGIGDAAYQFKGNRITREQAGTFLERAKSTKGLDGLGVANDPLLQGKANKAMGTLPDILPKQVQAVAPPKVEKPFWENAVDGLAISYQQMKGTTARGISEMMDLASTVPTIGEVPGNPNARKVEDYTKLKKDQATGTAKSVTPGLESYADNQQKIGEDMIKDRKADTDSWGYMVGSLVPQAAGIATAVAVGAVNPVAGMAIGAISTGQLTSMAIGGAAEEYDTYVKDKKQEHLDTVNGLYPTAVNEDGSINEEKLRAFSPDLANRIKDNTYDPNARLGSMALAAAAESISEAIPVAKFVPKQFRGKMAKFIFGNNEITSKKGAELIKEFAETNASRGQMVKNLTRSMAEGALTEGPTEAVAELGGEFSTWLYKEKKDRATWTEMAERAAKAVVGGSLMGAGIGPMSYGAQQFQNRQRRQEAGKVVIAQDKNTGEALEIMGVANPSKKTEGMSEGPAIYQAIRPNGKVIEIAEDQVGTVLELPLNDFNEILKGKAKGQAMMEGKANEAQQAQAAEQAQTAQNQYQPFVFQNPEGVQMITAAKYNGESVFITAINPDGSSVISDLNGNKRVVKSEGLTEQETQPFDQFIGRTAPPQAQRFNPDSPIQAGETIQTPEGNYTVTSVNIDEDVVQLENQDDPSDLPVMKLADFQAMRTPQAKEETPTAEAPIEEGAAQLRNLFKKEEVNLGGTDKKPEESKKLPKATPETAKQYAEIAALVEKKLGTKFDFAPVGLQDEVRTPMMKDFLVKNGGELGVELSDIIDFPSASIRFLNSLPDAAPAVESPIVPAQPAVPELAGQEPITPEDVPAQPVGEGVAGEVQVVRDNEIDIDEAEMNVLSALNDSKILTKLEKQMLYRQYKRGVMSEKDIYKYTSVDINQLKNGEVDKWGKVILNKIKSKEIDAETIPFEEVEQIKPTPPTANEVKTNQVPNGKELLGGLPEAGNQDQVGKDGQQLREEEVNQTPKANVPLQQTKPEPKAGQDGIQDKENQEVSPQEVQGQEGVVPAGGGVIATPTKKTEQKESVYESARKKGFLEKDGVKYVRKQPVQSQKGKEVGLEFAKDVNEKGYYTVIESQEIQPSHKKGQQNPLHFIPEAQPKNRKTASSQDSALQIAQKLDPAKIAQSPNPYSGSPVVNSRGEVIQGNNRTDAIQQYWETNPTDTNGYKQYLIDNAAEFGLDPAQIKAMKNPVFVRVAPVSDARAIELGNYDVKDIESGGARRIDPIATVNKMQKADRTALLNLLSQSNGNTLAEIVREQMGRITKYLYDKRMINSTQLETIINPTTAEVKPSGIEDISAIYKQFIFQGGNNALSDLFNTLPDRIQKGIEKAIPDILNAPTPILFEIQEAILAFNDFTASGIENFSDWMTQSDMFKGGKVPSDTFNRLSLELAKRFDKGKTQSEITKLFKEYNTFTTGTQGDMYSGPVAGITPQEAVSKIFNIQNHDPIQFNSRPDQANAIDQPAQKQDGIGQDEGLGRISDEVKPEQGPGNNSAGVKPEIETKPERPTSTGGVDKSDKVKPKPIKSLKELNEEMDKAETKQVPEEVQQAVSKYGWTATLNDKGDIALTNRKGATPATIKIKGASYRIEDTNGEKIITGKGKLGESVEKLLKDFYFAKENEKEPNRDSVKKIVSKDEGAGATINDLYDQWSNIKDEKGQQAWKEKVKGTKFGTYGTIPFFEQLDKLDPKYPSDISKRDFTRELESALEIPQEKSRYPQEKVEKPNVDSSKLKEINGYKITNTPSFDGAIIDPFSEFAYSMDAIRANKDRWDKALLQGVKPLGNGWYEVSKDISRDETAIYSPSTNKGVVISHKKGGVSPILVSDFVSNNPQPEWRPTKEQSNPIKGLTEVPNDGRPDYSRDIDLGFAKQAYAAVSFDSDKRGLREVNDYIEFLNKTYDELKSLVQNEDQQAIFDQEFDRIRKGLKDKTNSYLSAKSRTMSPMITGPARFPVERNRKAMQSEQNRLEELLDYIKKAPQTAKNRILQGSSPEQKQAEKQKVNQKILDFLQSEVDDYVNDMIGEKKGTKKLTYSPVLIKTSLAAKLKQGLKVPGLIESIESMINQANTKLKENGLNAMFTSQHNIFKTIEDFKKAAEQKAVQVESGNQESNVIHEDENVSITRDPSIDRILVRNPAIPSVEIRNKLKNAGWRWSPTNKAWQRKDTQASIDSAFRIFGVNQEENPNQLSNLQIQSQNNGQGNQIPQPGAQEELPIGDGGSVRQKSAKRLQSDDRANEKNIEGLTPQDKNDLERKIIYDFAKENNLWIDDVSTLGEQTDLGGAENTIFMDADNSILYKANNLSNSKDSIANQLEQVRLHNEIFPENSLEVIGFTGLENNGKRPYVEVVLKQRFIPKAEQATEQEITSYMQSIGFKPTGKPFEYSNGKNTVSDLRPRNVLKAQNGSIHVIDNIIEVKQAEAKQSTIKDTPPSNVDTSGIYQGIKYDGEKAQMIKDPKGEFIIDGRMVLNPQDFEPGVEYFEMRKGQWVTNREGNRKTVQAFEYMGNGTPQDAIDLRDKVNAMPEQKRPEGQILDVVFDKLKTSLPDSGLRNKRFEPSATDNLEQFGERLKEYLKDTPQKVKDYYTPKEIERLFHSMAIERMQTVAKGKQELEIGNFVNDKRYEDALAYFDKASQDQTPTQKLAEALNPKGEEETVGKEKTPEQLGVKNTPETITTESEFEADQSSLEGDDTSDEGEWSAEQEQEQEQMIQDFGDKIGGARKDEAQKRGSKPAKEGESQPPWMKKYKVFDRPDGTFDLAIVNGPYFRTLKKGLKSIQEAMDILPIVEASSNHRIYQKAEGNFAIYRLWKSGKKVDIKEGFKTKLEADIYFALNATELINWKGTEVERPHLDNVSRKGVDYRKGKNATPELFQETFGFRGGEFGNWVRSDERQKFLNFAYDGLMDLSLILNVPPKALSLKGNLAIAFGSRGSGGKGAGAAHYERTKLVINLTKINGAGSLAHEWFHAFDHYLGMLDGKASSEWNEDGKTIKAKDRENDYLSHSHSLRSKVRPELLKVFMAFRDTMFKKTEERGYEIERQEKGVQVSKDRLQEVLNDIKKDLERANPYGRVKKAATPEQLAEFDKIAKEILEGEPGESQWIQSPKSKWKGSYEYKSESKLRDLYKKAKGKGLSDYLSPYQAIRRLDLNKKTLNEAQAGKTYTVSVDTNFLKEGKKLDSQRAGAYWATPHEMAARAFEAYIEDQVAKQGESTFLVYGADNLFYRLFDVKPYPEGQERILINEKIEDVFKEIKVDESDPDKAILFMRQDPQTSSPAFKSWFGDSKVVNPDGSPMVVYHGTGENFDTFDLDKVGSSSDSGMLGKGFYFSSSPETSANYAKRGKTPTVLQVYLSLQNPFITSDLSTLPETSEPQTMEEMAVADITYSKELREKLISMGYDGVVYNAPDGKQEIVAFNPTQIKSATGNQGTFDGTNPDIRFSRQPGTQSLTAKAKAVADKAAEFTRNWNNAPKIVTVNNPKEALERYPELASGYTESELEGVPALFLKNPETGEFEAVLIASHSFLSGKGGTEKALLHEIIGHYGIREVIRAQTKGDKAKYRDEFNKLMAQVFEAKQNDSLMQDVIKVYFNKPAMDLTQKEMLIAADEYISKLAENDIQDDWVDRVIAKLRQVFRQIGFKVVLNDAEIRTLLGNSRRLVTGPKGKMVLRPGIDTTNLPREMIIGEKGASALDQSQEVTTRIDNLGIAREMETAKKKPATIRLATGWERGGDGKWKYEVNDDITFFPAKKGHELNNKNKKMFTDDLSRVIDLPEVYASYPELKDYQISFVLGTDNYGSFNNSTKTISINALLNQMNQVSTILHEVQHAIQRIEGFSNGGNLQSQRSVISNKYLGLLDIIKKISKTKNITVEKLKSLQEKNSTYMYEMNNWDEIIRMFNNGDLSENDIKTISSASQLEGYEFYKRLGGEVESRNVQSRMSLSAEERRTQTLQSTEDVSRKDQIFLSGKTGPSMSMSNQTSSPAFKAWFGNSKVVDGNGEPLVVYHGTQAEFTEFDGGAFFTDDYMNADGYAGGENVIETFIKIERPLIINARGRKWDNIGSKFGNSTLDVISSLDTEKYDGIIFQNIKDSWIDDVDNQDSGTVYYVSTPTQIKSATANNGDFNPDNSDIRFMRVESTPQEEAAKKESWYQEFKKNKIAPNRKALRYNIQDAMLPGKRNLEEVFGGMESVPDAQDFYSKENLFRDKIIYLENQYKNKFQKPLKALTDQIQKAYGLKIEDIDNYLMAMHNEERRRKIFTDKLGKIKDGEWKIPAGVVRKLKAELKDKIENIDSYLADLQSEVLEKRIAARERLIEKYMKDLESEFPTGMKQSEANQIKTDFEGTVSKEEIKDLMDQIKAINLEAIRIREEGGIISDKGADILRNQYQNYVPLRGLGEKIEEDDTVFSPLMKANGRSSRASSPMAYLHADMMDAIHKSEHNKVLQSFLEFAKKNVSSNVNIEGFYLRKGEDQDGNEMWYELPDGVRPSKAELESGEVKRGFDPKLMERAKFEGNASELGLTVMVNGQKVKFRFKDTPENRQLAATLKKANVSELNGVMKRLGRFNAWLSKMFTSYSPEFGLVNMTRDATLGAFRMLSMDGSKVMLGTMKEWPKALKNLYVVFGTSMNTSAIKDAHTREFFESGAFTGYQMQESVSEIYKEFSTLSGAERRGFLRNLAKLNPSGFLDLLSAHNSSIENGLRLAYFTTLRKQGMTTQKAASKAKDLTVNFRRKGNNTNQAGAIYAFFNANIQGTSAFLEPFTSNNKAVKGTAYGLMSGFMAMGFAQGMILGLLGDEEDEENPYNQISEFERNGNMIIPVGGGNFFKIPIGFGPNIPYAMGEMTASMMLGKADKEQTAMRFFSLLLNTFSPIGGYDFDSDMSSEQQLLRNLTPTVAKPVVDVAINMNFMGGQIYPEKIWDLNKPDSENFKRSTSDAAKAVAKGLNKATGGTQFEEGGIDWSPDVMEYYVRQYLGGPGYFADKAWKTGEVLLSGENPFGSETLNKVPFASRFLTNPENSRTTSRQFYDAKREVEDLMDLYEKYQGVGDTENAERVIKGKEGLLGAYTTLKGFGRGDDRVDGIESYIKEVNKQIEYITAQGGTKADLQELEDQKIFLMQEFVNEYKLRDPNKPATKLSDIWK